MHKLRDYLRRSKWFRRVFAVPLALRSAFLKRFRYRSIELYRRTVVGGKLILAPLNLEGAFQLDARSDLARRVVTTGRFEPEISAIFSRLEGVHGDAVNIGANVGFFSIFFALRVSGIRRVFAIEPNPDAFADLVRNIDANGCRERIQALQLCISDQEGTTNFAFVAGRPEYSSIGGIVHPSVSHLEQQTMTIPVTPLSRAIVTQDFDPRLFFVDTEGAELLVFRGAEDILRRHRPLLVFECDDDLLSKFGHSSAMLEEYLTGLGYLVRDAIRPWRPLTHPFTGEAVAFVAEDLAWTRAVTRPGAASTRNA